MSRSSKKKPRIRPGGYGQLHRELVYSPAYLSLDARARALLMELITIYRPKRNGEITFSVRLASERLACSKDSVKKAFDQLVDRGFVVLTGSHVYTQGMARTWRLTFEECAGREPTDDWKLWSDCSPGRESRTGCPKKQDTRVGQPRASPTQSVWADARAL